MATSIRIVIDTNWYVSATISKKSRRAFYKILSNNNFAILFCDELLKEYQEVIFRDKFKKTIRQAHVERFMNMVIPHIKNIKLKSKLTGSRDAKDNYLLSLSSDGHADYLITGDLDLLVLKETGSTRIVTLTDFFENHFS
jgi:putative PIN family toxin of toxin-antitoxin system